MSPSSYMIRNIDPELWRTVKSRAALEDKTLRQIVTELLTAYSEGIPEPPRTP